MCGFCNVLVCVYVGFVICGCFGNMCTCINCFFVLFHLCIFILICPVCTSVRTTATEWKLNLQLIMMMVWWWWWWWWFGVMTGHRLDNQSLILGRGRSVYLCQHLMIGCGLYPASCVPEGGRKETGDWGCAPLLPHTSSWCCAYLSPGATLQQGSRLWRCELDCADLWCAPVVGFFEHDSGHWFCKSMKFWEQLNW